jgi:hypothetical protein
VVNPPPTNPPVIVPGPEIPPSSPPPPPPPPVVSPPVIAAEIVAADDVAATAADKTVKIYVTVNDRAVHGFDKKSLRVLGTTGRGKADAKADKYLIEYHPNNASLGPQQVTYRICDTLGACDTATVTITVTPVAKKAKVAGVTPEVTGPVASGDPAKPPKPAKKPKK